MTVTAEDRSRFREWVVNYASEKGHGTFEFDSELLPDFPGSIPGVELDEPRVEDGKAIVSYRSTREEVAA